MTVELALLISSDGIALAHRQSAGHWAILRDVSFSARNLDKAMKALKKEAVARAGEDAACLLILPDDQILYTSLTAPTDDAELTAFRIEEGLEGMTPYAVSELVYDWRALETDRVKLAVVARETLDEARGFVDTHGFKAAGFAAMPPQERFPGVPLFDVDEAAAGIAFSDDGIAFGPDTFGQEPEEAAPDEAPEAPVDNEASGEDGAATADAPEPSLVAAPDAAPDDGSTEAADPEPAPEPEPEPEPDPTPEPEPDPEAHALADAADRDPEEVIAAASDPIAPEPPVAEPTADDPPPLEDPALTEPVAPIRDAEAEDVSDAVRAARNASTAIEGKDDEGSPTEFSARGAPVPARDADTEPTPGAAPDSAADDTPSAQVGTPAGQNPLAKRLSRVRDASKARPGKSAKPTAKPAAKPTGKPIVPPGRDAASPASPRKSRLSGLTASPFPGSGSQTAPETKAQGGFGSRLGGMLGRGAQDDATEPEAPRSDAGDGGAGAQAMSGTGRLTALGAALRIHPDEPEPPQTTTDAPDSVPQDANLTEGLLSRKPDEDTGPSFKTGLLLTIVLLILLAAIAVWSALFLPDSPVARLFGGGSEVASEDPLDAPDAPLAITAPPAIGELAAVDAPPATVPETRTETVPEAGTETASEASTEDAPPDALPEDEAAADGIDLSEAPSTSDAPAPDADTETTATAVETPAVPPLPPLPLDAIPSLAETEAVYAEYRIWQRPPDRPDLAPLDSLSDLSLSALDPAVTSLDAVSLPTPRLDPAETLRRVPPPPPFGARPATTAAGLVAATPEGVVTPDGVRVTAGPPPVLSIPRPREEALPPRTPVFSIEDAILGTFRPALRPEDLGAAPSDDAALARPTITRASLSPQPRSLPSEAPSASEQASAASLFPREGTAAVTAPPDAQDTVDLSPNAVARSLVPAARPANIDTLVANAVRPAPQQPAAVIEAAAIAPGPSIPSNADVARAATQSNELRLRDVNLIGVTGTASDRRALVRLPSGRFVRVGVGDRLNGGRVAAIGASTLQYVRGGRTVTLDIPG